MARRVLKAYSVTRTEADGAIIAQVQAVEPNGEEYRFDVAVTPDETTITGDDEILSYLNQRYGSVLFSSVVRSAVLREKLGPPDEPQDQINSVDPASTLEPPFSVEPPFTIEPGES